MDTYFKESIRRNMKDIVEHMKADDALTAAFSELILTHEEFEQIRTEGQNSGQLAQNRLFMIIMLKKENREIEEFLQVLKDNNNEVIAKVIEETTRKLWSGEMKSNITTLS